jgi:hypothetical protein
MALSDKMIALFARGAVEDDARPRYEATDERKAKLLSEAKRAALSYYDKAQADVRHSGYRVTKRVRDILWAELKQIEAEGHAKETVERSQLSNLKMVSGGEKRYSKIVCDGHVQQWVGIGWVNEGPATLTDYASLPVAV